MIVTGQAWGLISAVSPSKALAVYSGLQGGRQGLSLPRHNAPPPASTPHPTGATAAGLAARLGSTSQGQADR